MSPNRGFLCLGILLLATIAWPVRAQSKPTSADAISYSDLTATSAGILSDSTATKLVLILVIYGAAVFQGWEWSKEQRRKSVQESWDRILGEVRSGDPGSMTIIRFGR